MLNYSLKRNASKRFVKYYKENDDKIIIHYGDHSTLEVENTDQIKKNLNQIEENQVRSYYSSKRRFSRVLEQTGVNFLKVLGCGLLATLLASLFFGEIGFAVTCKLADVALCLTVVPLIKDVVDRIHFSKFRLFVNYQYKINERLEKEQANEKEIVNENTNNIVVKPKKVKNLCINDVNFMNYFQVRKMVSTIKAEEEYSRIMEKRYEDIGLGPVKKLGRK